MATININSSVNINAVTYVAGDILNLNSTNSVAKVRLTIDAQVPADVTKVETVFPGTIQVYNNSELYIVNTSTTTPLIVKLNAETADFLMNSPSSLMKIRGNYISIGTGTGAINQTLSTIVGGKTIDWPPFVEVETSAGSGVYIQYLNINGNRPNSASAVPTGYRTFSECATDVVKGAFFEYNELTNTIYFADATGGYPPPNGANIRIPNIHITVNAIPNYTQANRALFTPSSGGYDFDKVMFSNRFWGGFSNTQDLIFKNCNIPLGLNVPSIRGNVYIQNACTTLDVYIAAGGSVNTWVSGIPLGTQYVENFKFIAQGGGADHYVGNNSITTNIYFYIFNRINGFSFCSLYGNDAEGSRKTITNVYCCGQSLRFISLRNTIIDGIYISDRMNNINVTTFSINGVNVAANVSDCVFKTVRNIGAKCYGSVFSLLSSGGKNCSVIDVEQNCQSHSLQGLVIDRSTLSRHWFYKINILNTRTASASLSSASPNGRAITPNRVIVSEGSANNALTASQSILVRYNAATFTSLNANNLADIELLHVTRTSAAGSGYLQLYVGSRSLNGNPNYQIISGTEGTDFDFQGNGINFYTTSSEIIWESKYPAYGVTSMASAVVPALTGFNAWFQIKTNEITSSYSGTWTVLNTANLQSEFAALTSYSDQVGFHLKLRIIPTTANTFVREINVSGVGVNESFTFTDIGLAEIYLTNVVSGASVALAELSPSVRLTNYEASASTTQYFEYPHPYDGTSKDLRIISRKVGYSEVVINSSIDHLGATVPTTNIAAWPATNASVSGIAIDGALKTIVVTGTKTFQEVYQQSQYWSCLVTNLLYEIPMTSNDGNTFNVPSDWVLTWDIPTDKTLNGGKLNVSTPGSYSFKLTGTDIIFTSGGSYDLSTATLNGTIELVNTSGSPVTVTLLSGVTYVNTGPSITVVIYTPMSEASVTGILTGSRLRVYNETTATEIYNAVVASTSWTLSYNNGAEFTPSDIISIRATKCGATGYLPFETIAVAGSSGWSALVNQQLDTVYNTNAIDGSTITTITADYSNLQIDADEVDGTLSPQEIYAWFQYNLTTAQGISDYFGALLAEDIVSYKVITSMVNLKLENLSATPLLVSGARIYRDDGTTLSALLSSGSIHIDAGKVYAIETGTSGLTPSESALLNNLDATISSRCSQTTGDSIKSNTDLIPATV